MSISISSNPRMAGAFFSSMNSSLFGGSAFSGVGSINYSDYASIRNGSYHKLLSSYYSMDKSDAASKPSSGSTGTSAASDTSRTYNYWTKDGMVQRTYDNSLPTDRAGKKTASSTAISKETAPKLTTIQSGAAKLSEAADTLLTQGNQSLFKQTTSTDKNGNQTTGYNTDAIYKAVSSYVEQYNGLMKSAGSANVLSIRASAASIADYSKVNEKALSSIGITIDAKDNTLSLDEEKFKMADIASVKKLFQGSGSYSYQVSSKASAINYQAQYEASKASTYNSGGAYSYNYSSGSLWNGMI